MKSAFLFLVASVLNVSAGYGGDACKCPVKHVRDYYGCSGSGYSGGKSCYYMGKVTSHGGSFKGPTHTCTCDNGSWFNCYANQYKAPVPVPVATKNIVELAVGTPSLSTLVEVLSLPQYGEILRALQGSGPFTVFAPTNAAFASAGVNVNDVDAVTKVLMYHVLSGKVLSTDLKSSQKVSTLQGADVSITKKGSSVVVNDNAYVVLADVLATNGVVHVIDQVLKPPPPLPSIVGNALNTPTLSTLVSVLSDENYQPLLTALSGPGTFTVFAPTNAAFAAAGIDIADVEAVTEVLKYHVLPAD
jgi:transforming growth factor-beta-induced protein